MKDVFFLVPGVDSFGVPRRRGETVAVLNDYADDLVNTGRAVYADAASRTARLVVLPSLDALDALASASNIDAEATYLVGPDRFFGISSSEYRAANPARRYVPAEKFGIKAGTADMTARLALGANAALAEGSILQLPYGPIQIDGEVLVDAPTEQLVDTYLGAVNWAKPVGLRGFGNHATRIVQNSATPCRHLHYKPSSGNLRNPFFSDLHLEVATPNYTDVNGAGIEVGGGTSGCVVVGLRCENVSGSGLYAVIRADDCTGAMFSGMLLNAAFRYYAEAGYNPDSWNFWGLLNAPDHPQDVACTNTSGSAVLSGIDPSVMDYLLVGMEVSGSGVEPKARIQSKGATSITLTDVTTGNVSSFCTHLGALLSLLGMTGSAYAGSGYADVANAAGYANKARSSNPSNITARSVTMNRASCLVEDFGSSYGLSVTDCYMERAAQCFNLAGTGLKAFRCERMTLSQPETLRQPLFEIASSVPQGRISDVVTDGTIGTTVTVNCPNVTAYSEWGPLELLNVPGYVATGVGPQLSMDHRRVLLGVAENGSAIWEVGEHSGTLNFDALGVDAISLTPTGAVTIAGPNFVPNTVNRDLTFILQQNTTGGYTVTFDSARYKKTDGTDFGEITVPAYVSGATKTAAIRFRHTGANWGHVVASDNVAWV